MLLSSRQNSGEYHNIKVANGTCGNMNKLRKTPANQYLIHEEIKSGLNWGQC
jgi:hypothetical protein